MRATWIVGLLLTTALCGCGGGGGGGDGGDGGPVDVNGWWSWTRTDQTGTGTLGNVVWVELEESPGIVRMLDYEMPRTDAAFGFTRWPGTNNEQAWDFQILSADVIEGTIQTSSGGAPDELQAYRLARALPPTGTQSVIGTLFGGPTARNESTAYGVQQSLGGSLYVVVRLDTAREPLMMQVGFNVPGPVPLQTYGMGAGPGNVNIEFAQYETGDSNASAGTVQVTASSATHLACSYDLTLQGGDAVVGAFEVELVPSP